MPLRHASNQKNSPAPAHSTTNRAVGPRHQKQPDKAQLTNFPPKWYPLAMPLASQNKMACRKLELPAPPPNMTSHVRRAYIRTPNTEAVYLMALSRCFATAPSAPSAILALLAAVTQARQDLQCRQLYVRTHSRQSCPQAILDQKALAPCNAPILWHCTFDAAPHVLAFSDKVYTKALPWRAQIQASGLAKLPLQNQMRVTDIQAPRS